MTKPDLSKENKVAQDQRATTNSQQPRAKNICIIPARGGSKRIPRKNIRDFLGKPIIAYSIEMAINSDLFDEVMVSTDDEEIASVARRYGAQVPFMRTSKNANDYATLADVVNEVMDRYTSEEKNFHCGCCILPTAPFIRLEDLKKGLELLLENPIDSVRPVAPFTYPVQRAFRMNPDGLVKMFYPEHFNTRSQDLEPAYHDAGQFYWFRSEKRMRGDQKLAFAIPPMLVQDIDNEEDWDTAEIKYKIINQKRG